MPFDFDFDQSEIVTHSSIYVMSRIRAVLSVRRHDRNNNINDSSERKKKPRDIHTHESFIGV